MQPSCGCVVFSVIFWTSKLKSSWWPPSDIWWVLNLCDYRNSLVLYICSRATFKIILPYFGYQFNSCKFSVALTFPNFCRFFIYGYVYSFKVRTSAFGHILLHLKNLLIIMNMSSVTSYFPKCVFLQGNHCVTGSNIAVNKLKSKARMQHFFFKCSKKLYCDLVLYVVGTCVASSSFVGATSIC